MNAEKKLERRDLKDDGTWTAPAVVFEEAATGDPFAISHGKTLAVFVPTARGVVEVGGAPLPDSQGCEVSGAVWKDRLVLFLWKEGGVRWLARTTGPFSTPTLLPLKSTMPPGAVEHTPSGELWFGVGEDQDARRKSRWRLYRLGPSFEVLGSRWLAGESSGDAGNRRPNLLYEAAEDRLHWIATGMGSHSCFYDEMSIGDAAFRDGWLLKRYYDEWTQTRSAMAAVWHNNDILLSYRWFGGNHESDDNLQVAHHGLGIGHKDMSDHDDVNHMANYGLAHSLPWLAQKK